MKSSQQKQQQKRQPKKREYEIHLMDFNYASRRGKSESWPPPPWIFDCTHWVPLAGESCCILGGKLNEAEDTRTDPEIELQDFLFFHPRAVLNSICPHFNFLSFYAWICRIQENWSIKAQPQTASHMLEPPLPFPYLPKNIFPNWTTHIFWWFYSQFGVHCTWLDLTNEHRLRS